MQPSEPDTSEPRTSEPGTSLELTFEPGLENATAGGDPGALELPESPAPRMPDAPEPATSEPASTGPLGNLVVAHFRRVEIAMLGRVLISTLGGALPASMIRLEYRRSLGRRLIGRRGPAIGVTVTAGDRVLSFRAPEVGVAEASVGHVVRGVVLSTTPVTVAQWLDELGVALDHLARDDEATRIALEAALT